MIDKNLLKEIIDSIERFIPDEFGIDTDDDTSPEIEDLNDILWNKFHSKVETFNGVTKFVILHKNADEVIKIPFNGKFENYYGEEGEYDTPETEFIHFECANDLCTGAANWDYCENELIKYEDAVDAGFGEFFAATRFDIVNDKIVYLQETCEAFCDSDYSVAETSEAAKKSYHDNEDRFDTYINSQWMIQAIEYYGVEKVVDFLRYIRQHDMASDLHMGNIGYTRTGKPVLIDWAGYRE